MLKNIDGVLVYIGYTEKRPNFVWNGQSVPSWYTLPDCNFCVYDELTSGCSGHCCEKERHSSTLSDD